MSTWGLCLVSLRMDFPFSGCLNSPATELIGGDPRRAITQVLGHPEVPGTPSSPTGFPGNVTASESGTSCLSVPDSPGEKWPPNLSTKRPQSLPSAAIRGTHTAGPCKVDLGIHRNTAPWTGDPECGPRTSSIGAALLTLLEMPHPGPQPRPAASDPL